MVSGHPRDFLPDQPTRNVRLADIIDQAELKDQLDHARSLGFTESETVWLAGNKLYGRRDLFDPEFIEFLRGYRLPDYHFEMKDGQYELTFSGSWVDVTLWEIYALTIINELRNRGRRSRDRAARSGLNRLSKYELDKLYTLAKTKLWAKLDRLSSADGLKISDFGTRRRHSHLWQEWAILAAAEELGPAFTGTSNAFFAHKHGFEAIGTNAHELPMVLATLAKTDADLKASQYTVLERWQQTYAGALLVMLPDTYGSTQFLRDAPAWAKKWTGIRIDSKDPFAAGEEAIAWWKSHGCDPCEKRILFSDGLDVEQILALHKHFQGRVRDGYGWGTLLTNDFRGCHPSGRDELDPDLPGLQGDRGQRPPGRQAERQLPQSVRPAGRDRPLPCRFRHRRRRECAAGCLSYPNSIKAKLSGSREARPTASAS